MQASNSGAADMLEGTVKLKQLYYEILFGMALFLIRSNDQLF